MDRRFTRYPAEDASLLLDYRPYGIRRVGTGDAQADPAPYRSRGLAGLGKRLREARVRGEARPL